MSLSVVERDGTVKHRCGWCDRMKADTYCQDIKQRQVNRRYLCRECHAAIAAEVVADYREQVRAGIPRGQRMVLYPISVGSQELHDEIRARIMEIDSTRPASVRTA